MNGLYKRVLKGSYPKIPTHYSSDLSNMIKMLIQVAPINRPSCDKILKTPIVHNKVLSIFQNEDILDSPPNKLLKTIRIPKNILYLTDKLPKPNYCREMENRKTSDAASCYLPLIKGGKSPSKISIRKRLHYPKKVISLKVKNLNVGSYIEPEKNIQYGENVSAEDDLKEISSAIKKETSIIEEHRKKISSIVKSKSKKPLFVLKKQSVQENSKDSEIPSNREQTTDIKKPEELKSILSKQKVEIKRKMDSILKEFGVNIPNISKEGRASKLIQSPYINSALNHALRRKLMHIPAPSKDQSLASDLPSERNRLHKNDIHVEKSKMHA